MCAKYIVAQPITAARPSLSTRFHAKVDSSGGPDACWPWRGCTGGSGHGVLKVGGRRTDSAHRLAYTYCHGAIPDGCVVRHTCDNPKCCNPAHLLIGTHAQNVADRVERKRSACGAKNGRAKLTVSDVQSIRRLAGIVPIRTLAATYDVDPAAIRNVITGKCWKSVPHDSPTTPSCDAA